jgi:hypothetical protein
MGTGNDDSRNIFVVPLIGGPLLLGSPAVSATRCVVGSIPAGGALEVWPWSRRGLRS